ncbi:guanylate kinase [Dichotomicrobium thermohalophilum]|uniref:Guanylate kinase n=1 Tax=Dichotomicrobium thermohalophilum TaxID=933063 RepID=A0A397Q4R9_9HYPH|nr:guanylate kinase [Dichotomicrobium thermohalophilum]RIA56480.1 guanylate kinase [Dichotomicrobium thermohalophilum]
MHEHGETGSTPQEAPQRKGFMLVLSSPSGAGKTSLARKLLEVESDIAPSISVTTRSRRPTETDGVDYWFVTPEQFTAMRDRGELLEWANVFGNLYGTPKMPVEQTLEAGSDVLFDIDWQGGAQLRKAAPHDVVCVFILPPSAEALRHRLRSRATESPEVIEKRLAGAPHEIDAWQDYQYVIVNDDFDQSLANLRAILRAERLRRERQTRLPEFVAQLQQEL